MPMNWLSDTNIMVEVIGDGQVRSPRLFMLDIARLSTPLGIRWLSLPLMPCRFVVRIDGHCRHDDARPE